MSMNASVPLWICNDTLGLIGAVVGTVIGTIVGIVVVNVRSITSRKGVGQGAPAISPVS